MSEMSASIFMRSSHGGELTQLKQEPYKSEDLFQKLLADHAQELLAGDQIDPEEPRRWLLVGREVGIPGGPDQGDRWNIDHVFLDQDATPTFVELKRSSDPRIRREVVGQLIEYASNAGRNWSAGNLKEVAKKTWGEKLEGLVSQLLHSERAPEAFWSDAEVNLRDGRLRLIFAADKIPLELRRMIEFMNDQMRETEVLALEVRQYLGPDGQAAFVPFVLNASERLREVKGIRKRWDEASFFDLAKQLIGSEDTEALRQAYAACQERSFSIDWGTGAHHGSFKVAISRLGEKNACIFYANGTLTLGLGNFPQVEARIRERLLRLEGIALNDISFPSLGLSAWRPHLSGILHTLETASE